LKQCGLSSDCIDFLCCLLNYDESKRTGIKDILSHTWLQNYKNYKEDMIDEFNLKSLEISSNFNSA